ncbi:imidazole glycerol phosphate synthase subunit HisH [Leptospira idonii]|uniref:Imidazole glycerol phosphate synthase subunit HisH n=1 Tax=Leptospira idonii TaxID=1193500 RepID=A0A4R9LXJ2_9LEPT|nr:imidazole glycerol phosphate synthase subunit HisH [Leptospira idonii]TGN18281.1 imidazole glycerol phosphate synthase subunit HisH [Leptospira idonii]
MIGILDYGVGNLKAFANILKNLGFSYQVIKSQSEIESASKIILPGVGSFDSVMEKLENSNVLDSLSKAALVRKIPILGVCVGMQILADSSEEGKKRGLGWIHSKVKKFQFETISNRLTVPQIGWNNIKTKPASILFKGMEEDPHFYFLHSYYIECENSENEIASANYGIDFTCAVNQDNIFGTQFHPEKSHHNGVQLLKNFASI